jgi:hypothetical protein
MRLSRTASAIRSDHRGLVHLIGDLGDDDGLAVAPDLLDLRPAAHQDRAAPGVIGRADAGVAEDQAAGGEIGPGHDLDQLVDADLGVVDIGDAGVDHLAEIVRRHVGGHADGDAAGAVDQQVGKARRQHDGLVLGVVVVGLELDGVLVDVVEQRVGRAGEAHFGVAHGRRRVAVDGAEIALAVDQRQAQREFLRHAHQRVVDRLVAVRVILADDVADDAGRLAVGLVPVVAVLVHREQDAPVHGLQAVAHVGQRARHDHAHGVIEIGALHLLFDGDRADVFRLAAAGLFGIARRQEGFLSAPALPGQGRGRGMFCRPPGAGAVESGAPDGRFAGSSQPSKPAPRSNLRGRKISSYAGVLRRKRKGRNEGVSKPLRPDCRRKGRRR